MPGFLSICNVSQLVHVVTQGVLLLLRLLRAPVQHSEGEGDLGPRVRERVATGAVGLLLSW